MLRMRKNLIFFRVVALLVLLGDLPFVTGLDRIVQAIRAQESPEDTLFEVQSTLAISDLAAEHKHSAQALFEWVRTNIRYELYNGSFKGAGATLSSRKGNDLDQALLLGSLLDASNVPWRLVSRKISLPMPDAQKWLGVSNVQAVPLLLQKAGVQFNVDHSKSPEALVLEKHFWLEVKADYFPLRGAASDDVQVEGSTQPGADPLETWVALDPSLTYREDRQPVDLAQHTGLNPADLLEAFKSLGTITSSVNFQMNTASKVLESAALNGRRSVQSYLKSLGMNLDMALGTSFSLALKIRSGLPSNLPYTVLSTDDAIERSGIAEHLNSGYLRKTMKIEVVRNTGFKIPELNQTFSVPRAGSGRVTLSFSDEENALGEFSGAGAVPLKNNFGEYNQLTPHLKVPGSAQSEGPKTVLGELLWVEISVGNSLAARIPVRAGGRYQLIPVDSLSAETLVDSQAALSALLPDSEEGVMEASSLDPYLTYAGQTLLHEANGLQETARAASGYAAASEPSMMFVGLEPVLENGSAEHVQLVAHKISASQERQVVAVQASDNTAESVARTSNMAWEAGLVNGLELISGQSASSAGKLMADAIVTTRTVRTLPVGSAEASVAPTVDAVLATLNGPVAPQPLNDLVKSRLRLATLAMPVASSVSADGWGYLDTEGDSQVVSPMGMGRTAWANVDNVNSVKAYDLVANGSTGRYRNLVTTALEGTWQLTASLQNLKEGLSASFVTAANWLKGQGQSLDPVALPAAALMIFKTAEELKLPRVESVSVKPEVIKTELKAEVATSLPVDSLAYAVVHEDGTSEPLTADFMAADNHSARYDVQKSVTLEDGDYQLGVSGRLANGAASALEFAPFTVDKTAPVLTLALPTGNVEGRASVRGSIDEPHLKSWVLEGRKQESDPWDMLSSGTTALPMESQLAMVDTQARGWRGSVEVRLTATDIVGNETAVARTMNCVNDVNAPQITLTEGGSSFAGTIPMTLSLGANFSDNNPDQTSNRGLKSSKVYLQSETAPNKAPVILWNKKQYGGGTYGDNQTISYDSRKLNQSIQDESWTLVGEAEDVAGNKGVTEVKNLKFADALWSFQVTPVAFTLDSENTETSLEEMLGGAGGSSNHTDIRADFKTSANWSLVVKDMAGVTKATLGSGAGTRASAQWFGKDSGNNFVEPGAYQIVLTYDGMEATRLVSALAKNGIKLLPWLQEIKSCGSEDDLSTWSTILTIPDPVNSSLGSDFLASDKWPILALKGKLPTELMPMMAGGSSLDEPAFPPPFPGPASWYLAFKATSTKPTKEDVDATPESSVTNWDNWHLIKSGTHYPADGIVNATLDTSSLPAGYYDVQLWVTGGLYASAVVVFNLKVSHGDEGGSGSESGSGDAIGALTLSATDMTVPFDGAPVTVSRNYNSNDIYSPGPLGYGWTMNGVGLEIEHSAASAGEYDEAYLKLPDGRKFFFATARVQTAGSANSRWAKYGEYVNRPYGMKLLRPGGSETYHYLASNFQTDANELKYWPDSGNLERIPLERSGYGHGAVAYLQTEDKTWYVFEWRTGDLIEVRKPDGQIVSYNKTGEAQVSVSDGFRTMRMERDPETGRIKRIYDPNNNYVEYTYDAHGNLSVVRDRSGRKRFYLYDTPETKAQFPERKDLTGRHVHYLVDVRVDDDLSPEYRAPRFSGDTVPPDAALTAPDAFLSAQEWPGDLSVFKSQANPDGSMKGIETFGGTVGTEHQKNADGTGTEVVSGPGGVAAQVAYDAKKRMTEQVDFWGAKTSYAYDDASAANKVPGLMSRETNALNEVTSYTYAQMPGQVNKSFADMFQKYVNHQIGDDSGQTGYLTSAQSLPTAISMDATGRDSVTTLTYDMAAGSASEFQPKEFGAPGGTGGKLDYDPATGKLAEVKVLDAKGHEATKTINDYWDSGEAEDGEEWKVGMLQKTTVFASASDATGRSTEYNYRREGTHLISTTRDPLTGLASQSETDATGNLTSSTSAMNQTVIARSDGEGRGIEAYDEQGNRVVSFYNVLGQKVLERLVHVYETGVAPMVILTITSYDEGGRVTKVSRETDKGRVLSVNETAYEQTSWGRMETSKGTDGLASRSYYDAGGRLTKSEQLDASGGVMSWGAFTYDPLGRKIAETSSGGAVTSTTYDSLGRVVKTQTTAPGVDMISETGYDAAGRVTSMTQPTDQSGMRYTHNRYDDLGRLVQTYYNSTGKVLNPAQAGLTSTTTTYDNLGRREYAYNEEGIATRYVYDASGRMKETWLGAVPLAGIAGVRYQYEYDDFGNVTRIVDPMGHDRIKKYNAKGQLWREYTAAGNSTTDLGTKRQVVEYTYYTGGQLKEKKQGVAVSVEGTHTFTRSTTYEYDPATGLMVKETASQDGLVQLVTARTYDGLNGRLAREEVRSGTNAVVHWKSYAYDPKTGKESLITSPEGSIAYTYHKDGSLASISTGSGQSNSYTYDAMERIVRLQSTVLGPHNQPKAVTYEYSSSLGLQKRVNYPNGTYELRGYDERGWLRDSSLQLPDGYVDNTYGRDKRGLITSIYYNSWTSTIPNDEKVIVYGYDRLGRITSTSTISYTGEPDQYTLYEYDDAGNRTREEYNRYSDEYGYVALDTLFSWDYNPLNQCVFEYKYRPSLEETDREYNFDIYGNQKIAFTSPSTYYTWDVKDRLASATAGDKTITFTYDAEGQRIRKQVAQAANPPKITNYLTDNQNPSGYSQTLEETNKAGAPTTGYAWGSGGALAQRTGAGVVADGSNSQSALESPQTLHGDHLGSTRLLTDASGEAVEGTRYEYNPFGTHHFNAYYGNATALTALKFTGQYADGDLGGLQYHRARWLNTTRAAWLSADPVYDFPGNFGNGYAYAGQNPTNGFDLSGLEYGLAGGLGMAALMTTLVTTLFPLTLATVVGIIPYGISQQNLRVRRSIVITHDGVRGYIREAAKEFEIDPALIGSVFSAEADDSIGLGMVFGDGWEGLERLVFVLGNNRAQNYGSFGLGQLRLLEVEKYRIGNRLISNDPELASLSNAELVMNYKGNVYLTAAKIKYLLDTLPVEDKYFSNVALAFFGVDVNKMKAKTSYSQGKYTYGEARILYESYNEELYWKAVQGGFQGISKGYAEYYTKLSRWLL